MSYKKLTPAFTFTEDRLAELRAVVPEAFAEGKVNWESLREALGDYIEDEGTNTEPFGLFWPGKRQARRLAAMPSKGTLKPAPGEGVNEANTQNVFIEGDNLEVLKLLQKSYAGRVKMIYIDPPYNTGNDFVYKDDFIEPLDDYLRKTGQMDEVGQTLTSNTKSSGRYHSTWLNMMFPRLLLARQLLKDSGVIFISIDDNEFHNLRQIMGEIFGEENFVATICWERADSPKMDSDYYSVKHDFILCYAKSILDFEVVRKAYEGENLPEHFNKVDQNGRRYYLKPLRAMGGQGETREARPNLYYPITAPDGTKVYPKLQGGRDGAWRWGREKLAQNTARIEFIQNGGEWTPYFRVYADESSGKPPETMLFSKDVGSNRTATTELKSLFDGNKHFDTPKPTALIRSLLTSALRGGDEIVMDFFAGSCTTAHAVLQFNRDHGSSLRFVMVQLPEDTGNVSRLNTIAEIGKERIRRVIKKLKAERRGKLKLEAEPDLGFRVYKLTRSNYRPWQDYSGENVEELEDLFSRAKQPLVDNWKEEDLLAEILLLEGFPLDSAISEQKAFKKNRVHLVESDACSHRLLVCIDPAIFAETVTQIKPGEGDIFVCLDDALTDKGKVQLSDAVKLHVI